MQYSAFHLDHGDILESAETALRDTDGTRLYESWDSGLLSWIIHFNDVPRLKQYLSVYKSLNLDREEDVCFDPLEVAAQAGSMDALAFLVEHYYKTTSTNKPLNRRKHSLLSAASSGPHLGTAQFILGLQPTPHSVDFNQSDRDEALLAAAGALNHLPPEVREHETPIDLDQWRCNLIARGEKLIHLLLDNGASAQVIDLPTDERQWASRILCGGNAIKNDDESQSFQSFGTTLGLASSRAGSTLVKRLIHQGANIHVKEQYQYYSASHFWFDTRIPWNVTSLHISSMYWNTEALQTLLDHWGRDTTESLSSRDSNGRLPLHWAAAGPGSHECWLSDIHVKDRIIDTLKLVLTGSDINARDDLGANALHHAISGHASCSGSKHFSALIKFLLDNGAEADVVDKNGQTVLHRFASNCRGEPIDISLMETLLLRGAKINQQDKNGNTVLHRMVTDLQQVQAVKFLISRGIDISIVDSRGNTALHHCLHSGSILDRETSTGLVLPTFADQRRALDEMREILLEAGGHNMMDQPNLRGETPRQFQFNRLERWRRAEFPHLFPKPAGRGRPIRNDFVKS
ncbi:Serine/threonine-protein phosphatase 6 regulatory ankyrin repeat subunit B [Penicillium rolfsii]|nr:Serine/threonine-protein phosphatase 6 regulatory ankyrin repeat subunit B [Penicillium rolfsii]